MELKCKNCGGVYLPNASVCSYCGNVINQEGEHSIENITNDLEGVIKLMKGIEIPTLWSSFKKNSKFSMPLFTISSFILAYKINGLFALLGVVFFVYSIISIFKKSTNPLQDLKPLKAEFDEKIRVFTNLYGANNTYKLQIQQFQNEWKNIENASKKGKFLEWSSYVVIFFVFIVVYALPTPKTSVEINNENLNSEQNSMLKADSLLNVNNIELAKKEMININSNQNTVELKSKIQLKEIELKLAEIESKIKSSNTDLAATELAKITWIKTSVDYDSEQFEQKYYKQFIILKSAVNDKLPENKRVKVEDEFDF